LKVLHLTNWYPSFDQPFKASWIVRQIRALETFCSNDVYHIEVETSKFKLSNGPSLLGNKLLRLSFPSDIWFLKELMTSLLVLYVLFLKLKLRDYDVVNFHIAYPMCTYLHLFQNFIKKPIVITEHWSAYHLNFGVKKELNRIKRIFNNKVTWITVSEALKNDLIRFSGNTALKAFVIPNVVDSVTFTSRNQEKRDYFFMASYWRKPKNPILLLRAFRYFLKQNPGIKLRIGGFGPQEEQIIDYIEKKDLHKNVEYLGSLTPEEIAEEMNIAMAFLHCSEYETFSVVCAEALICGTPVIASAVGGLTEIIEDSSGILVQENTETDWVKALSSFINSRDSYNSKAISEKAAKRFSESKVGKDYMSVITEILDQSYE
jgi:glycosyltransferase involved in cell wall biosynthesis